MANQIKAENRNTNLRPLLENTIELVDDLHTKLAYAKKPMNKKDIIHKAIVSYYRRRLRTLPLGQGENVTEIQS